METSSKYISLGPADYTERVSNTVRVSPAKVHGGIVHRGGPPAGSGNGTGNKNSVRERGHRICTSLKQGNRVLQPVFHSSKEGWGLCPILDLRVLNESVTICLSRDKSVRDISCHRSDPRIGLWLDLKDAYFHISILPCHRKFLRFACGGKTYPYRVLPFGLAFTHTFTKCVDAALMLLRLQGIRIMNYIDVWRGILAWYGT